MKLLKQNKMKFGFYPEQLPFALIFFAIGVVAFIIRKLLK
jgi:hypothetical protein